MFASLVMETLSFALLPTCLWYTSVCLLVAFIYWHGYGKFQIFKKLRIPGPTPLPFVGNAIDVAKYNFEFHRMLGDYTKKYGDCYALYFQNIPMLIVSDPEMLKQILVKDFAKFHDRQIYAEFPEPGESFLTIAKGERWKFIRNLMTPTFTSGKMRAMSGMMNKIADTFMTKCDAAADKGESIDFVQSQQALTMEAVLSIAFGMEAHSQTDPNDPLTEKAKYAMSQPKWITAVSMLPGSGKFLKYLPYGFSHLWNPILKVAKDIIKKRRQDGYEGEKKDFLQLMLDAQDEPDQTGRRLTDEEVLAQAMVFLLAGYETSSTTLALTCYELAANQAIQEKLYQEVQNALPNNNSVPDYDLVQKLEYLDMTISETMRLYPPGFLLLRTCNEDCEIKGIPFKRGFNVMVPCWSMHRDSRFWDEPEKYNPERFSPEEKRKRDPFIYLPFGDGPRNCIGMRFAQMEMKIVMARIIRDFKLEFSDETKVPPKLEFITTLCVRESIKLKITRR